MQTWHHEATVRRTLKTLVLTVLGLAWSGFAAELAAHWEVPTDAKWELIDGRGTVTRGADAWTWDAQPVDKGGTLGIALPVNPADYDEIRFEYMPTHGPVQLMVTVNGYPDKELSRNWYNKNVVTENAWNPVCLDLNLDDDGRPTDARHGLGLWLRFGYEQSPQGDDPTRRTVCFRNVRLVRHPVVWETDPFRIRTRRENGQYLIDYPLVLRNRTAKDLAVTLKLKREPPRLGEPLFELPQELAWKVPATAPDADWPDRTRRWGGDWAATQGDVTTRWVTFRAPEAALASRFALWTEVVWPELEVEGYPDALLPLTSSRMDPWFLAVPPAQAVSPVLEATPARLERARQRNRNNPQFKSVIEAVVANAERLLRSPLELPRNNQGRKNAEYYEAWSKLNNGNVSRCQALAEAYALSGRAEFARGALDVLEAYADRYPYWEPLRTTTTAFRGRFSTATLLTGFTVPGFFLAYDYLYAGLSLDQRRNVEDRFLLPLVRELDGHCTGYTNQMTQQQLPVFWFAVTTGRWCTAARYVEGPRGLFAFRKFGFDADGMGMERDLGYHWNTIDPIIRMTITLENLGWQPGDLDWEPMLRVPIALSADPGAFAGGFPFRYEWANARFGRPEFGAVGSLRSGNGTRSLDGLLIGADTLPEPGTVTYEPMELKTAGYLVMPQKLPAGPVRSITVNYGSPHHRLHIDLLSVHVSEAGKELIGMMGQSTPGVTRTGWYSTIADSLLAVNGRDQITGRGRVVRKQQAAAWQAVEVATDPATPLYEPATDYHRLVFSAPSFVLLLDRVTTAVPADFQWAFYPGMDMTVPADWQPAEPPALKAGENGGPICPIARKEWRAAPAAATELSLLAEVKDEKEAMPLTVLATPAQVPYSFATAGNQKGPAWIHALLLYGKQQTGANWVALLDRSRGNPPGGKVTVERLPLQDKTGRELAPGAGTAVAVTAPDGRWVIAFAPPDAAAQVPGVGPLENGWLIKAP